MFGKGCYFAKRASLSFKYNHKRLIVARVLTGDVTGGNANYLKPPPKNASLPFGEAFDTCVDNPRSPSMYVTFEFAQAYPAYVIDF